MLDKYRSEARDAHRSLHTQPLPQHHTSEIPQPRKPSSLPGSPRLAASASEIRYEGWVEYEEEEETTSFPQEHGIREVSPIRDQAAGLQYFSPLSTVSRYHPLSKHTDAQANALPNVVGP
jgi:hypothetical protein